MPPAKDGAARRFFGKYRGHVVDNNDQAKLGRILALVPDVDGLATNWAWPCTPYAGPGVGMLFLPPVDALVWIEFEGGEHERLMEQIATQLGFELVSTRLELYGRRAKNAVKADLLGAEPAHGRPMPNGAAE